MTNKNTHETIRMAIIRIEKGRPNIVDATRKMSVAAVAEESGVSRALIHRDMPDLLERIKGNINKTVRSSRDDKNNELKKYKLRNKELRDEIKKLGEHLRSIQSLNATLMLKNEQLFKTGGDN